MLRDEFATCPRCKSALDATADWLECGQCHGMLIADTQLYERVSEAQIQTLLSAKKRKTPWRREEFATALALEHSRDGAETIACPSCAAQMTKHLLYEVEIDRCPAHGIWLDDTNELRGVMTNAAARI